MGWAVSTVRVSGFEGELAKVFSLSVRVRFFGLKLRV